MNPQITINYPGQNLSRVFDSAAPRFTPVGQHTTDPTKAIVAATGNFIGFLAREVVVGGPALADHVYPGRQMLPDHAGGECSIVQADEVEAEGATFLDGVDENTAVNTEITFLNGKFHPAVDGETVFFKVLAQLTPEDSGNAARVRFIRVGAYVKAPTA